jgi:uncharacterized membrane protein
MAKVLDPGAPVGQHTTLVRTLGVVSFVFLTLAFQALAAKLFGRLVAIALSLGIALSPWLSAESASVRHEAVVALLLLFCLGAIAARPSWRHLTLLGSLGGLLGLLDLGTVIPTVVILLTGAARRRWTSIQLAGSLACLVLILSPLILANQIEHGDPLLQARRVPTQAWLAEKGEHRDTTWPDYLLRLHAPSELPHIYAQGVISAALLPASQGLFYPNRPPAIEWPTPAFLWAPPTLVPWLLLFLGAMGMAIGFRSQAWPVAWIAAILLLEHAPTATLLPAVNLIVFYPVLLVLAVLAFARLARLPVAALPIEDPPDSGQAASSAVHAFGAVAVPLAMAGAALAFAWISYTHLQQLHDNMISACSDTCFFSQPLWNVAHGHGMRLTFWNGFDSLFAVHLYLITWLLVPVYGLWPHAAQLLFVVQAAAMGAAGIAAYRVTRVLGAGKAEALAIGVLLLVHPSTNGAAAGANIWGYHSDILFPALFLIAYEAHLRASPWFWILFPLSLTPVEHDAIVWASVGMVWLATGPRRKGLVVVATGLIWWLLATRVVIPHFAHGSSPYYFTGLSVADVPHYVAAIGASGAYATEQLISWMGLPALSPLVLATLPELAVYAQAFASGYSVPLYLLSMHAVVFIPLLAVSSAEGLIKVLRWRPDLRTPALALMSAMGLLLVNLSYLSVYQQGWSPLSADRAADVRWMEAFIPEDADLSGSQWVTSHFAERYNLYHFPEVRDSDYVLIDNKEPYVYPPEWESALSTFRDDPTYRLIAACDGFELFERNDARHRGVHAKIPTRCDADGAAPPS